MNKALIWFSGGTLILAYLVVAYVGFLHFQPFHEPDVVQPFPVLNENKTVERGGVLRYEAKLTKYSDVKVTNYKNIICKDGNLVTIADLNNTSKVPLGTHTVIGTQNIPHKTSLGECKLVFDVIYHVNQLKDVERTRETEWFTVTP